MGLADEAARLAADAATAARRQKEDRLTAEGRNQRDRIEAILTSYGLDLPVTYVDSFDGKHPVLRRMQFGGQQLGTDYHTVHRITIDDVTVWLQREDGDGEFNDGCVQRPCARCGATTFGGPNLELWRPADPDSDYTHYHPDYKRAEFMGRIGQGVRSKPLCWNCEAQVGDRCPTCHRPFTDGMDWDKWLEGQ